ncbi:MAG: 2-hydroxyacid dehydrogenase [Pseudonocardiaceae bacterium]
MCLPYADVFTDDGMKPDLSRYEIGKIVYSGDQYPPNSLEQVGCYVVPHPFVPQSLDLLPEMPHLEVLQLLSSGVDHVLPRVPRHVVVCNAPDLHAQATAEVGLSLILASLNHVPSWVGAQRQRLWRDPGPRPRLVGKCVLLLGYGAVGRALEVMLGGFDVRLVRVARRSRPGVAGVDELMELLPNADIVVIAAPLTEQSRWLVGRTALARMRPGTLVVNISRGPVVDTDALVEQLGSGRLRAALDVTDPEPLPPDHPLWRCPGTLISPHVGGNTADFRQRAVRFIREQLRRFLVGEHLANVVRSR